MFFAAAHSNWGRTNLSSVLEKQLVRTICEIPIEIYVIDSSEQPRYQKFAVNIQQLKQLGLNRRTIATQIKLDLKTVSRAIPRLSSFDNLPFVHSTGKYNYFDFLQS